MSEATIPFSLRDAREFAVVALLGAGANPAMAASLARATVDADARSPSSAGFSHLVDYLEGLVAGRINGKAEPRRTDPAPALIRIDADGGIAQLGFDLAYDDLVEKAKTFGIALFAQFNSYTSGELGDYVFRLAERGLVGLAATNGPALIAGSGSDPSIAPTRLPSQRPARMARRSSSTNPPAPPLSPTSAKRPPVASRSRRAGPSMRRGSRPLTRRRP